MIARNGTLPPNPFLICSLVRISRYKWAIGLCASDDLGGSCLQFWQVTYSCASSSLRPCRRVCNVSRGLADQVTARNGTLLPTPIPICSLVRISRYKGAIGLCAFDDLGGSCLQFWQVLYFCATNGRLWPCSGVCNVSQGFAGEVVARNGTLLPTPILTCSLVRISRYKWAIGLCASDDLGGSCLQFWQVLYFCATNGLLWPCRGVCSVNQGFAGEVVARNGTLLPIPILICSLVRISRYKWAIGLCASDDLGSSCLQFWQVLYFCATNGPLWPCSGVCNVSQGFADEVTARNGTLPPTPILTCSLVRISRYKWAIGLCASDDLGGSCLQFWQVTYSCASSSLRPCRRVCNVRRGFADQVTARNGTLLPTPILICSLVRISRYKWAIGVCASDDLGGSCIQFWQVLYFCATNGPLWPCRGVCSVNQGFAGEVIARNGSLLPTPFLICSLVRFSRYKWAIGLCDVNIWMRFGSLHFSCRLWGLFIPWCCYCSFSYCFIASCILQLCFDGPLPIPLEECMLESSIAKFSTSCNPEPWGLIPWECSHAFLQLCACLFSYLLSENRWDVVDFFPLGNLKRTNPLLPCYASIAFSHILLRSSLSYYAGYLSLRYLLMCPSIPRVGYVASTAVPHILFCNSLSYYACYLSLKYLLMCPSIPRVGHVASTAVPHTLFCNCLSYYACYLSPRYLLMCPSTPRVGHVVDRHVPSYSPCGHVVNRPYFVQLYIELFDDFLSSRSPLF